MTTPRAITSLEELRAEPHNREGDRHGVIDFSGTFGAGSCRAHHGEILQGIFRDQQNRLRRGLVSLPLPLLGATAKFLPTPHERITVLQNEPVKTKAAKAAEMTLRNLGLEQHGGYLFLANDCPLGWGLGSSTCDVVATIRAVADAFGVELSAHDVGKLAVRAELASDSVMFDQNTVLFAHHDGLVLEEFANPLPCFEVVAVNTDNSHRGIDTLRQPFANYTSGEVEEFDALRRKLQRALQHNDLSGIGKVATASATINDRYLPKPYFATLLAIASACQAVGVQVAHSGSVIGLLFDPDRPDRSRGTTEAITRLRQLGLTACYRFFTAS